MLSQHLIELNADNRRAEKEPTSLQVLAAQIEPQIYSNLIEWVVQFCTALEISPNAKYRAKCYLDQVVMKCPQDDPLEYIRLAVACTSLAIKHNQNRSVSDRLNANYLFKSIGVLLTPVQIFHLQQKVLTAIDYKLRFTTPFDYYTIFAHCLPKLSNMRDGLELVMTFGLVLPQCCGYNAQEMFYACVLAILSYKKIVLEPVELNILKSLSDKWARISILSQLIIEQLIQDQESSSSQQ